MSRPRREDITSVRWLQDWSHTIRTNPHAERTITQSLRPIRREDGFWAADLHRLVASTISFCFDAEEFVGIVTAAGDSPTGIPLPPLPFRRVMIEATRNGKAASLVAATPDGLVPAPLYNDDDPGTETVAIEFALIFEETPGARWNCLLYSWTAKHPDDPRISGGVPIDFGITTKGVLWERPPASDPEAPEEEERDDEFVMTVRGLCVDAIHAIHARSVNHFELSGARQFKRGYERSYQQRPPSVYFVDTSQAGENHSTGSGLREYSCRWLVRGHYRHTPHGGLLHPVTGQRSTWVRPHVKGPVGAPWKGRPVHLVTP